MTTENNKTIAEFMGLNIDRGVQSDYMEHELKYHKSWDWLMPVVSKCLNVYHIEEKNDDLNFNFYDSIGNLEYTYKVVVEFIKDRG